MYAVQYGKNTKLITHTVTEDSDSATIAMNKLLKESFGWQRVLYSNGLNLILNTPEFNNMVWIRVFEYGERLDIIT